MQFIDPAQREWTAQDVGSDDTIDSDIDPMTSYTTPINLAPGEEHTTTDAGLLSERASLGDKVFEDLNENGIQDSGEPGLSNVAVNLWTDSDGDGQPETLVDSTTTDISGMYSFTDLNPNINYVIEFVAPLEREWTTQDQGSDDAQDSDADPTNGRTSTIDLAAGENNSDMDAGLLPVPVPTPTPSASPSPTATPSPTMTPSPTPEPPTPTPSASPTLSPTPHPTISCEGGTPVVIGGHTIIFAGVQYDYPVAGESTWYYCVESGSAPAISHVTYDLDLVAEGGCIDIVGDVNGVGTWDAGPENLSANDGLPQIGEDATTSIFGLKFDEGFEDGEMRQYYFTVDGNYAIGDLSVTTKAADDIQKGFVPGPSATCENSAVLGNFVWEDSNGNGVQDFGEQGMSDVTVNLYSSDGVQVDTTTTDENGYYSFTVTPGDYYVDFAAPGGYHFTTIDQGNNDATDSDANPVSGQTSVTTLEAGENDLSWDAGLLLDDSRPTISCEGTPVTVGNHQIIFAGVYYDYPATGQSTWFYCVESGSSPSLSHITYDLNLVAEGGCLDLVDEVNSVGTWGPTADYLNPEGGEPEIGNDPGTSIFGVKFDEGLEDGQMAQYYFTVDGNYAVGDMTVGTKAGQNIDTGVIPGPSATCENGAVISGTVWEDDNDNGLQDQAEPGLANVTVNLYDSNNVLVNSTTSDANGHYSFTVSPGDYHVEFVKPNGYSFTPANVGDDDTLDSDANTTTGHTTTITVQAGDNLTHWDAGLQSDDATSTVSCDGTPIMIGHHEVVFGGVRYDYPSAGQSTWYYCVNSGSHPSISHVTYDLDLVAENGCLDLVDGTNSVGTWGPSQDDLNAMAGLPVTGKDITTNIFGLKFDQGFEDGESRQYYFTVDGNYSVDEILLAAKAGRDLATGMVPGPSPTCNANATVGDMVWRDNNGNGIQDSGEVGLADVTVNLYDANGLVASTTTDSSGKYSFSVTPGDYYVEFVLPNGYIFSPADEGSDDTADSDANPITGQTIFTTLEAGENDTSWDAGLQQDLNSGAINCEGTPVAVGNDGIIFAGVRYDYPSAGQSTWYYCIESGSAPSISHVLFDLNLSGEGGCQNLAGGMQGVGTWGESANALHATAGQPEIGEDPTTSLFGLKFDQGFGDGEKRLYYFTLYNNYVVGEMNVATKAGPGFDTGTIPGPVSTCEIDGGEVCSESFSNTMWLDTNGNGVQDAGESGLADATVQLTGTGPDGELGTADDVQQATDTTDSNGSYEFFNVPPGLYRIDVDESTLTNGLALTTGNEPMIVRVQECNTGRAGQRRAVQEEVTGQGYAASVCERSVMYGAHDGGSFDSQFFMLDLATGESSPIGGQHNGLDAESIELNPETGELLVMSGGDSNRPGKLWTLDRDTGEITEIGSTGAIGTDEIVSAAFASDGTLWAFQQNVGLVTVNLSDGSTTVVWNFTGLGDGNWEGLAWDPSSSYLYGSEGTKMYRWNPADQSVEQVCGDDFLPSSTEALDFRFDGQLLGGWHNAADNALSIFEIDIASCEYQPITLNTPYNDVEALASEECVTPGSVEGTVVDGTGRANQGGNPVAGLELELKVDMNGDGTYNEDLTSYATTDENGHYQFVNLPRGKYTIAPVGSSNSNEFELAGEDLSQGVDITHTETTAPDTFDLYLPLVLR